jgi:catechol 2,3-dioxygenase-like lactoylglutathione lyase family enzyme
MVYCTRLYSLTQEGRWHMAVPDMVGLVVGDMGRALAFYRLLGLEVPEGQEGEAYVETTANGYRISWNTQEMMAGIDPVFASPEHRMGVAFKCDGPAEVDALYERVTAAGFRGVKEPWDAFWGQRYAVVEDPDGNFVDLFAPL